MLTGRRDMFPCFGETRHGLQVLELRRGDPAHLLVLPVEPDALRMKNSEPKWVDQPAPTGRRVIHHQGSACRDEVNVLIGQTRLLLDLDPRLVLRRVPRLEKTADPSPASLVGPHAPSPAQDQD